MFIHKPLYLALIAGFVAQATLSASRAPMQGECSTTAGPSEQTAKQWTRAVENYSEINVEAQQPQPGRIMKFECILSGSEPDTRTYQPTEQYMSPSQMAKYQVNSQLFYQGLYKGSCSFSLYAALLATRENHRVVPRLI